MTQLIIAGAAAGLVGGLVNLFLWYLTLTKKKLFGTSVHKGFAATLKETIDSLPDHIDTSNLKAIEQRILDIFDEFMSKKLIEKMPVLSMFIDEKLINEIRTIFRHEMEVHLPNLLKDKIVSEKNLITVVSMLTKSYAKGLKKYLLHGLIWLLLGTLAGALTGALVGWIA